MVITNAATGNVNVKALVYDDAYIPAQGDSVLSLTTAVPGSCLAKPDPSTVFNVFPYPNSPSGDADLYVKPSLFPGCFAGDIPAADAKAHVTEVAAPHLSMITDPGVVTAVIVKAALAKS